MFREKTLEAIRDRIRPHVPEKDDVRSLTNRYRPCSIRPILLIIGSSASEDAYGDGPLSVLPRIH